MFYGFQIMKLNVNNKKWVESKPIRISKIGIQKFGHTDILHCHLIILWGSSYTRPDNKIVNQTLLKAVNIHCSKKRFANWWGCQILDKLSLHWN